MLTELLPVNAPRGKGSRKEKGKRTDGVETRRSLISKHSVVRPNRGKFGSDADFARYLKVLELGIPSLMQSRKDVLKLARGLDRVLHGQRIAQARFAMRGSSVTGRAYVSATRKYEGKKCGPESDYDFAIVSHKLFERLRRQGVEVDSRGRWTVALEPKDLRKLGLGALADHIDKDVGRRTYSVVVYTSTKALESREAALWLDETEPER